MPPLAELIIFHQANRQHHSPNHHVGQLSALLQPTAILPPLSAAFTRTHRRRLGAGALLATADDDHR